MADEYLTDDEQWESIKRGLAENGVWIVAGVVLGAGLLFGWRYYQSHQNEVALQAAAQFGEMTSALELNDHDKARAVADGLIKRFPGSPYADQAQLTVARLFVDEGKLPSAITPLTRVMNESKDAELKHIARLRLARVLIDQGKPDEALETLAEDPPGAFTAGYHEVRGDAFYAKKDLKGALTEYRAALGGDAGNAAAPMLQLKIADLGALPPTMAAPASAPAITTPKPSNKATP